VVRALLAWVIVGCGNLSLLEPVGRDPGEDRDRGADARAGGDVGDAGDAVAGGGRPDAAVVGDAADGADGDPGSARCTPDETVPLYEEGRFRDLSGWEPDVQNGTVELQRPGRVRLHAPGPGTHAGLRVRLPRWCGLPVVLGLRAELRDLGDEGEGPGAGDHLEVRLEGGGRALELLLTASGAWLRPAPGAAPERVVTEPLQSAAEQHAVATWSEDEVELQIGRRGSGLAHAPATAAAGSSLAILARAARGRVEAVLLQVSLEHEAAAYP